MAVPASVSWCIHIFVYALFDCVQVPLGCLVHAALGMHALLAHAIVRGCELQPLLVNPCWSTCAGQHVLVNMCGSISQHGTVCGHVTAEINEK
jgi:hypothetical protein